MNKTITERSIPLDHIDYDPALQIRCGINWEAVDDYAELMKANTELPKPKVYEDKSGKVWIADGWHRIWAHKKLEWPAVVCEVHAGSRQDALKYALGANASHGLRRTNKDKRRAVLIALEAFPKLSARGIAGLCKVHHSTVISIKKEVSVSDTCVGQDGKEYPTASSPEPEQLDFYDGFNAGFDPVFKRLETFYQGNRYLTDPAIDKKDKIHALKQSKDLICQKIDAQIIALKEQD